MTAEVEEHQWASDEMVKKMVVADDDELLRLTGEWCEAATANWFPKVLVQRLYRLASALRSSGSGEGSGEGESEPEWPRMPSLEEQQLADLMLSCVPAQHGPDVTLGFSGVKEATAAFDWLAGAPDRILPASPKPLKTGGE